MEVSSPNFALPEPARAACAAWLGPGPLELASLPGPGFSGAAIARVRPPGTSDWFVLKSFAVGTPRERAEWVHALARHLSAAGVAEVAAPSVTPAGDTLVTDARGVHWELVPFVDGVAVEEPDDARAAAALDALARLHAAAAGLPGVPPCAGPCPGVLRRMTQARRLAERSWLARRAAVVVDGPFTAAVADRWDRAIAAFETAGGPRAVAAVAEARPTEVPLQAVLRDVWSDHVLFTRHGSARVAGIVDFHAADIDSPAVDLARLLGSWHRGRAVADPTAAWPAALDAYAAVRRLAAAERGLLPFLNAAGVLCGLDNWFRWTLEERRSFAHPAAVVARVDRLLGDLADAVAWLAGHGPFRV